MQNPATPLKFYGLVISIILFISCGAFAQNMLGGEYFYDSDPGYNNGIPFTFTPSSGDVSNSIINISTMSLAPGVHNLYVRTKDELGGWSNTQIQSIMLAPVPTLPDISEIEYFFNVDPGEGNGNALAFGSSDDIQNLMASVNISALDIGTHMLFVRSKAQDGTWSHTHSSLISVLPPSSSSDITAMEYFFNSDPGEGNGISVPITASQNHANLVTVISAFTADLGFNRLFIRTKDSKGSWSLVVCNSLFFKPVDVDEDIVEFEYYLDTDPGEGNGTSISLPASNDIQNFLSAIDLSATPDGFYNLGLRTKTIFGKWSHTIEQLILKKGGGIVPDIIGLEYFIDNDPGEGNATSLAILAATNVASSLQNINLSAVAEGTHILGLRAKTSQGIWSHVQQYDFWKRNPDLSKDITAMEYFFGTDPGLGSGTAIPLSSAQTIVDLSSLLTAAGLSDGVHELYLRSKDVNGIWSLTNTYVIFKKPAIINKNIIAAEYFIDTDPGYGNGTAISIATGTDISSLVPIATSGLDESAHSLNVRTKDQEGKWTHTYVNYFKVKNQQIEMMSSGEYFFDTDPGLGAATSFVLPAISDVSEYDVIVMADGLTTGLHNLYVRTRQVDNVWSHTYVMYDIDKQPALPVNWLDFQLSLVDRNSAQLDWTVAEAENTSHYEVEKSLDGVSFRHLKEVASINSKEIISYSHLDKELATSWNYYRIKQLDLDGSFTYSEIRSVFISPTASISVFPNPTTEYIQVNGLEGNSFSVRIFDASQKMILEKVMKNDAQIDFANYVAGPYFVTIEANSQLKHFLIIKQ